ncbi:MULTISPECIES: helix-turn-helix domain-containing protein [Bacteroides]|jgi:transcriptional regulator with XRE-family HTH domain|uniref:Helix-turn-helix transcriptional regulator n=1 Tax=Bacteroides faecis TaxID=674529 RepID=A0ABY5TB31_9BACE|nr:MULTISPECIES: helix-turn-helix transcriptional regulator [Bacteroides]KAA5262288.1 helix-turn-helix transcriptional regulator [Bacteroides faecis]KAA5292395.1 helix-turn-helix transcriptional regulator [Bacteroides faecis]KAA5299889.1 helix-turn-helix transcriptional regulator [Bacteroides faecis]UVQ73677.1 helix-turn-helix transcriptional regulator [Bacteroides faecis]
MYLRIKDVLKEQNATAKELAERVGISRENITNIINEKSKPAFDTLVKISEALNVPLSELFSDSQKTTFVCPNCGAKLELKRKED